MTEGASVTRVTRFRQVALPPILFAVVVIGLWTASSYLQFEGTRRELIQPPPQDVLRKGFLTWRNLHEILEGAARTTKVALVGLAVAIVLGVGLAVIMSQAKVIERSLVPYAVALQTVPIIAITPMIIIWFGTGFSPRVVVCVMIALFPIITNTLFGLKSPDRGQRDLFELHHAGRVTRLLKLHFPSALPAMFTGFRIAAGLSVIGAIVGEIFFKRGAEGLGQLIFIYQRNSEIERLMAALVFSCMLGVALFVLFGWLNNRLTRHWRPDTGSRR